MKIRKLKNVDADKTSPIGIFQGSPASYNIFKRANKDLESIKRAIVTLHFESTKIKNDPDTNPAIKELSLSSFVILLNNQSMNLYPLFIPETNITVEIRLFKLPKFIKLCKIFDGFLILNIIFLVKLKHNPPIIPL